MNGRGLAVMAVLTTLAVLAAFIVVDRTQSLENPPAEAKRLFPDLAGRIAEVARIESDIAGDTIVLERQGEQWTLPAKDHYPADQPRVAQILSVLATLTVIEPKTADPARYADLSLAPPSKETGAGREIKLLDGKGAVLADVIAGRVAMSLGRSGGGLYVRRADQPQSWLAEGTLDVPSSLIDWTHRKVFDLSDTDAVAQAVLKADDKTVVTVSRDKPDDEDFKVVPAPPGRIDQGKALRLATVPVALNFEDVKAAGDQARPIRTGSFKGFDGIHYQLDVFAIGKEWWARPSETGSAAADKFTADHKAWLYKLPVYRMDMLQSDLAGFAAKPDSGAKGEGEDK